MDFPDVANRAGPQPFARLPNAVARVALIAHLGRQSGFLGDSGHQAGFPDVVRQRLFAIDVLAVAHRKDGDVGMQMIRRGAQDGVDGLLLLEHFAEIHVVGYLEIRGLG